MKAIVVKKMIPKIVEVDYKYFLELRHEYETTGQDQKAYWVRRLLEKLDQAVANGSEMSQELIERTINIMIDSNERRSEALHREIKTVEKETAFLRSYSERDNDSLVLVTGLN